MLLLLLAPVLLLLAATIGAIGISQTHKKRPRLHYYEAFSSNVPWPVQPKPQTPETSGTLEPVATAAAAMARRAPCATRPDAILQFVLDALYHLTGLPLLMVNQPDHNLPCVTRDDEQMRADQKNAELLSPAARKSLSSWSDEAPEELSDLSSDSEFEDITEQEAEANSAQSQLFDGLQFYLAVTQVRERTVRSVISLGIAKTINTLREQKQRESIAVIEQQYPDFTCLPTRRTSVTRPMPTEPMDLLSALRLPSAATVARKQTLTKRTEALKRDWNTAETPKARARRVAALASPHNSSLAA